MAPNLRSGPAYKGETRRQAEHRIASQDLRNRWKRSQIRGPSRGLENPSVLCYQNCILVSLLHAPKFVNWTAKHSQGCESTFCVACSFYKLSACYWDDNEDEKALNDTLNIFRRIVKNWGWQAEGQNDAIDYYRNIIDQFKQACPLDIAIIDSILILKTSTTNVCTGRKCCTVTRTVTPQITDDCSLAIPMAPAAPLSQLIERAFADEIRTYNCDERNCNATTRKSTIRIAAAPHILTMQILRVSANGSRKLPDNIPFDEDVDLACYQEGTSRLSYRLRSVVQHQGELGGGHYVAIVRDPWDQWMLLNDSKDPIMIKDTAEPNSRVQGWTSYCLFWEKEERGRSKSRSYKTFYEKQAQKLKEADCGLSRKRKRVD